MKPLEKLSKKIEIRDITVAVIGLGYVGLPLVSSMCKKNINVIGLDIDRQKIEKLQSGISYIETVQNGWITSWVDEKIFTPSNDFSKLGDSDVILMCVPTPLDEHFNPDLSYVENTVKTVGENLRKGQLVILESTTYPGTMNDVVRPILDKSGLECDEDYFLVYSPEREDPGNKNFTTSSIPKIVGADTPETLALGKEFYSLFIDEVVPVSSMAVAEASKIMENIFRSVNIALVNELKVIFDRMGLNIWEIIEAVKTKPFGYMPFYPGPGLGGHCIPVDPFYLSWKAREYGVPTRFIELAGEINTAMPKYVVDKTIRALNEKKGKALKGSNILVMGVAYKKNVNDHRETPAFPIMEQLTAQGAKTGYYDPFIPEIVPTRHHPALTGLKSLSWKEVTEGTYDAIIVVTDHDKVDYEALLSKNAVIIDTRGIYNGCADCDRIVRA